MCCTPRVAPIAKTTAWSGEQHDAGRAGCQQQHRDQHDRRDRGGDLRAARVDAGGVSMRRDGVVVVAMSLLRTDAGAGDRRVAAHRFGSFRTRLVY